MLHCLWKETCNRLQVLERAVQQGRAVDEASNFARWLSFSGLYRIFEAYPQPAPLEVDGKKIRALGERLVAACGVIYKGGTMAHNPSQSTVDEINLKVDGILAYLAKKASSPDSQTADVVCSEKPAALLAMPGEVSSYTG